MTSKFFLTGDIRHAGVVAVEADTLNDAIDKADDGEFTVLDEMSKMLAFDFAGHAEDEEGNDLDHLLFVDRPAPAPTNQACPRPGERIGERTCVASCHYFEAGFGDDPEHPDRGDEYLVLLLNAEAPYFKVAIITPDGDGWRIIDEVDHYNIVPAVTGDHPLKADGVTVDLAVGTPGYTDMGGDY